VFTPKYTSEHTDRLIINIAADCIQFLSSVVKILGLQKSSYGLYSSQGWFVCCLKGSGFKSSQRGKALPSFPFSSLEGLCPAHWVTLEDRKAVWLLRWWDAQSHPWRKHCSRSLFTACCSGDQNTFSTTLFL